MNQDSRKKTYEFEIVENSEISITTDSGIVALPVLFRKKIVQTNISYFALFAGPSGTLVAPKFLYSEERNRYLELSEILREGLHKLTDQSDFDRRRIIHIDLPADFLSSIAYEIEEFAIHDCWRPSKSNLDLVNLALKCLEPNEYLPRNTHFMNAWVAKYSSLLRGQ